MLLAAAVSGCGTTLKRFEVSDAALAAEKEKQKEVIFAANLERNRRLFRILLPLRRAAAKFCGGDVAPSFGFILHDAKAYTEEYRPIAVRHFGLDREIRFRDVHQDFPAWRAGVRPGDVLVAVNGKPVNTVAAVIGEDISLKSPGLKITIRRDGGEREVSMKRVPNCKYPVQLVSNDSVNAFADGGKVMITTGMFRFAEKDEELALVVGHEIAHNHLGHITKKIGNTILGSVLDAAVAVVAGVNTQGLFGKLAGRAFSKEFEAEADYSGVYITARAGFEIEDAPKFWRRMSVEHPGSVSANFLATHPSTPERFLELEQAVKGSRAQAEGRAPPRAGGEIGVFRPARTVSAVDELRADECPVVHGVVEGADPGEGHGRCGFSACDDRRQ